MRWRVHGFCRTTSTNCMASCSSSPACDLRMRTHAARSLTGLFSLQRCGLARKLRPLQIRPGPILPHECRGVRPPGPINLHRPHCARWATKPIPPHPSLASVKYHDLLNWQCVNLMPPPLRLQPQSFPCLLAIHALIQIALVLNRNRPLSSVQCASNPNTQALPPPIPKCIGRFHVSCSLAQAIPAPELNRQACGCCCVTLVTLADRSRHPSFIHQGGSRELLLPILSSSLQGEPLPANNQRRQGCPSASTAEAPPWSS